jgi:single-stranded-DNA-specific exonuclease
MEGIGFDLGHWCHKIKNGVAVDLLYALDENTWNNKTSIQLVVKDIRETTSST